MPELISEVVKIGDVGGREDVFLRIRRRDNTPYLVFKTMEWLSKHWRPLNWDMNLMTLILEGETLRDGFLKRREPRGLVGAMAWLKKWREGNSHNIWQELSTSPGAGILYSAEILGTLPTKQKKGEGVTNAMNE